MRRICKIVATTGLILALLGTASVAQASTTTAFHHSTKKVELVHRHHHHKRVPKRLRAYRWAITQRNKPYIWGGTGPYGYDCSGLVWKAYRRLRIYLPRTTYEMLASWKLVRVPFRKAKKGDLAFFGDSHVEFYDTRHVTFGAADPVMGIGWHREWPDWHPTMIFRVRHTG